MTLIDTPEYIRVFINLMLRHLNGADVDTLVDNVDNDTILVKLYKHHFLYEFYFAVNGRVTVNRIWKDGSWDIRRSYDLADVESFERFVEVLMGSGLLLGGFEAALVGS